MTNELTTVNNLVTELLTLRDCRLYEMAQLSKGTVLCNYRRYHVYCGLSKLYLKRASS